MTALPLASFLLTFLLSFVSLQKAKKKKPKLLNKLDKTIKAEIDAAEKLRKKVETCQNEECRRTADVCVFTSVCLCASQGKLEEALRAFETLVQQHPQSPRARYGKAQVRPRWPVYGTALLC